MFVTNIPIGKSPIYYKISMLYLYGLRATVLSPNALLKWQLGTHLNLTTLHEQNYHQNTFENRTKIV